MGHGLGPYYGGFESAVRLARTAKGRRSAKDKFLFGRLMVKVIHLAVTCTSVG